MTYADIAAKSGVSKTTVSLVLRGLATERIPTATRERVEAVSRELGYYPNNLVRSLQRGRTFTLALVAPRFTSEHVGRVVDGVRSKAAELGYSLLIGESSGDMEQERQGAERLLQHRADGVIRFVRHTDPGSLPTWMGEAIGRSIPCVVIDDTGLSDRVDCVVSDDEQGAFEAVRRLLQLGHRRVAHLSGSMGKSSARERLEGYRRALGQVDPACVVGDDYVGIGLEEKLARLFRTEEKPTALFAATDFLALQAIRWARAQGIRVPEELSVVGYSGWSGADAVGLTTVAQPFEQMGALATERLVRRIEHPDLPPQVIRVPTEWIERTSAVSRSDF